MEKINFITRTVNTARRLATTMVGSQTSTNLESDKRGGTSIMKFLNSKTLRLALPLLLLGLFTMGCPPPDPGPTNYTVTLNANGGVVGKTKTISVESGKTATAPPEAELPTFTGYTLTGWNTKYDGSGTPFVFGKTTVTADITIYAQWTLTNVAVTGVTVSPTSASVAVGATTQLTATIAPTNATNKNVTWSSSDVTKATVNSSGLVTAVAAGSATITATSASDNTKKATATITVTDVSTNVAVTSVTVSPTSASVAVGATTQLTATIAPTDATNKNVTWSSSDVTKATVNSSGLVTGVAAGSATITATSAADNTKKATATITVTDVLSITDFNPKSGAHGTLVTITGTKFSVNKNDNIVYFNETILAVPESSTALSITVKVPINAVTGKIKVNVSGGVGSVTSTGVFTVTAPIPTITSFSPTNGVVGTAVTITGTNFSTTAANNTVKFNNTAATVSAATATSITTTVPSGATTGKISVTVGTETGISASDFTVNPFGYATKAADYKVAGSSDAPTYSGTAGTYSITSITKDAAAFDNTASPLSIDGTTGVITWVATLRAGVYAVNVANTAGGTNTFTLTINAINPTGYTYGTIAAFNYGVGKTISLTAGDDGGADLICSISPGYETSGITINQATGEITVSSTLTPLLWRIPVWVKNTENKTQVATQAVTSDQNYLGTGSITAVFTINAIAPTNFSYQPDQATVVYGTAGSSVAPTINDGGVITGYTLSGNVPTGVTIDNTRYQNPDFGKIKWSNTVAVGTYAFTVRATNGAGYVETSYSLIVEAPAPTIASFSPTSGAVGSDVTITGTNFSTTAANNSVMFSDGTNINLGATIKSASATEIVATVPPGAKTGRISVTVGGQTATSASDFTVDTPAPTITSFTPTSGGRGSSVTITGTNFSTTLADNSVTIGGVPATVVSATATTIVATVSPFAFFNANVDNPITVTVGGTQATSSTDFTVVDHTITGFTPDNALVGASIVISGTDFDPELNNYIAQPSSFGISQNSVSFTSSTGTTRATVTAASTTSLTVTVPAGAITGTVYVAIGATEVISTSNFTVIPPATFQLSSTSFTNGAALDANSVLIGGGPCNGSNNSPQLSWSGAPTGTKSYAIEIRDPDAPLTSFLHWLVVNIPTTASSVAENEGIADANPAGGTQLGNDYFDSYYDGPCPPPAGGSHTYHVKVYALSVASVSTTSTADALDAIALNTIGIAEMTFTYSSYTP